MILLTIFYERANLECWQYKSHSAGYPLFSTTSWSKGRTVKVYFQGVKNNTNPKTFF